MQIGVVTGEGAAAEVNEETQKSARQLRKRFIARSGIMLSLWPAAEQIGTSGWSVTVTKPAGGTVTVVAVWFLREFVCCAPLSRVPGDSGSNTHSLTH